VIFRVFSVPLKHFLDFPELFLALKKPILSDWAEPEGPTQSAPTQPPIRARFAEAHLGPG
jgi:hypothetical protein